ncbi:hypothetical protein FOA43_004236 [Brettanomyces nanus]|uniref:Uncharacterized protein n=1 Tax=Eeniella nana TaxID=13502 RepID=A0A875SAN9_EENNA|nr:uncharacterized protein FOA43_004236 [Brettanomyces nanus]QPG76842.1 hypothetical protein FOA43_004236 [Brettanomyces nanus]
MPTVDFRGETLPAEEGVHEPSLTTIHASTATTATLETRTPASSFASSGDPLDPMGTQAENAGPAGNEDAPTVTNTHSASTPPNSAAPSAMLSSQTTSPIGSPHTPPTFATATPADPSPGIPSYISLENKIGFPPCEEASVDGARIPRSLCIPYARQTVKAFAEFLYTGQVGSNWKIFPTATELLMLAKRYDIPLLYNLVLEMLFVVLARKEAQLMNDARKLKAVVEAGGIQDKFGPTTFGAGSAIDRFSQCLAKLDDGFVDRVLFKRASKVARRTSSMGVHTADENATSVRTTLGFLKDDVYETSDGDGDVEAALADAARSGRFGDRKSVASSFFGPGDVLNNKRESSVTASTGASTGFKSSKEWPSFKQLVSPHTVECSDTIVEMLIETGAIANDMKLMLRAINVKEMSLQYRKQKREVMATLEAMKTISQG